MDISKVLVIHKLEGSLHIEVDSYVKTIAKEHQLFCSTGDIRG